MKSFITYFSAVCSKLAFCLRFLFARTGPGNCGTEALRGSWEFREQASKRQSDCEIWNIVVIETSWWISKCRRKCEKEKEKGGRDFYLPFLYLSFFYQFSSFSFSLIFNFTCLIKNVAAMVSNFREASNVIWGAEKLLTKSKL